jgi:hypothetical protein
MLRAKQPDDARPWSEQLLYMPTYHTEPNEAASIGLGI